MNRNARHYPKNTKTARRPAQRSQPEEDSPALWVKHLTKSLLITLAASLLLMLGGALIAYFTPDPNALVRPLSLSCAALAALIGGFAAVRIHKHSALLCGILNGSLATALMMLLSLFFTSYSSGYSAGISALLHAAFILFSVAGAFLGLPKGIKRR